MDIVERLIAASANVNHTAELGVTPLSLACKVRKISGCLQDGCLQDGCLVEGAALGLMQLTRGDLTPVIVPR